MRRRWRQRGDALDCAAGHGESYEEFLRGLAKASGIATPTREDLARLDRKRKKRTSNKEWKSPADEDARIAKMKDGRTHLAHKAEHAVDLDTARCGGHAARRGSGDTTTLDETLCEAGMAVASRLARGGVAARRGAQGQRQRDRGDGHRQGLPQRRGGEADEGVRRAQLHSGEETEGAAELGGQTGEQQAVYANRRRVRGEYGKSLLRRRGELVERSFAHCYETAG